jgi:uncharacterized protein
MMNSIFDALLQLSILTPLAVVAIRSSGTSKAKFLIVAALVFIVTEVTTDALSGVLLFEGQTWNWAGKTGSLLVALVFIVTFTTFTTRQFGLTAKIELRGATPILLICTVYFVLRLSLYLAATKGTGAFHAETFLFQATLPGMAEEVVFRGILLTLLDYVFIEPRWTLAHVSFGWAAGLTSILFGLTHGISFDSSYHIQFNAFAIARTAFDGFLFAILVTKTQSLLPGIVFHNLLNLIGNH